MRTYSARSWRNDLHLERIDFMTTNALSEYYNQQYDATATIPDHAKIFGRWVRNSGQVRSAGGGVLDIAYGESEGEKLDLFPAAQSGAPLIVFIHGGWWRSLDKKHFHFMAGAYRDAGINFALTNYTLAPAATLEEITRQQARALGWLYRNADQYGYDRNRIVVAGHSAGAQLAAVMMTNWGMDADLPRDLVKGGILLSGVYDLETIRLADSINVDVKLQPEDVKKLSPVYMDRPLQGRFITAVGALEAAEFRREAAMLIEHWKESHVSNLLLAERNHLTICDAFCTPNDPLFEAGVQLINSL